MKKTKKIKQLEQAGEIEVDINNIDLEELLVALGGVLFAGADIQEIDAPLLSRLEDLIKAELILRENSMNMPTDETLH
jgi:hypothetical protein|tara:strand:+ start:271 stop:504 length:234 start_codon:yes stop_codon:yes gene_type:complete